MKNNDYYSILGLDKNADINDIKKAYRTLSFKYHPDRNSEPDAKEKFQSILQAYETLSDPVKKQQYDFSIQRQQNHPFGFGNIRLNDHFIDLNEIFNSFGMGGHFNSNVFQNVLQKPVPIVKHIEITLEQSYHGYVYPLEIERWTIHNNEKKTETETIYVDIPQGIDTNEVIVCRNKGNVLNNISGDIKLFVKILPHNLFKRSGLDLVYSLNISLKKSLCGLTIDMEHLNKKIFRITNNPGSIIKQGERKIIPTLGMHRGEHKGNLIVEFNIVYPETLTEEQVIKLNEIL